LHNLVFVLPVCLRAYLSGLRLSVNGLGYFVCIYFIERSGIGIGQFSGGYV